MLHIWFSTIGISGDAAGMSNSTFRLTNGAYNGSRFSPQIYPSFRGGSVARITTYSVSKMGGYVSFGAPFSSKYIDNLQSVDSASLSEAVTSRRKIGTSVLKIRSVYNWRL
jgi:hypothetical protein